MSRIFIFFTTLFLLLISFNAITQDLLLEQNIRLKSGWSDKRDVYPVVNKLTGNISLFLLDKTFINLDQYDPNYKLIDYYQCQRPQGKFRNLIGHTISKNNYNLFFTNKKKKEFLIKSINTTTKVNSDKILSIKFKNERYIESFSYKNKFYILSIFKQSSCLKLYAFEGNDLIETKEFDFQKNRFNTGEHPMLSDVICSNIDFKTVIDIQKIENENPNSLDLTSSLNKLYCYNDQITLSLDHMPKMTVIINIDLNKFTSKIKSYNKVKVEKKEFSYLKSNSYLYRDILYQIKVSKYELCFSAYNLKNDSLIREYRVKKDQKIHFKNSKLIQNNEGAVFSTKIRELEKTKQILRKMTSSEVGISVYETGGNLEITLGGKKTINQGSGSGAILGAALGMVAVPIISGGAYIAVPNPTMYSYSSYSNTKSVYFKCMFNKLNMQHIEGKMDKNPFDKIKDFDDETKKTLSTQTIFKIDDYYVWGYYDTMDKKYYLRKFE